MDVSNNSFSFLGILSTKEAKESEEPPQLALLTLETVTIEAVDR